MYPRTGNSTSSLSTNYPGAGVDGSGEGVNQQAFKISWPDGLTAEKILAFARSRRTAFDAWFKPQADHIQELWKMFENQNTGVVKSNKVVSLPIPNGIVETINSRLAPAILNRSKFVDAIQNFVTPDDDKRINVDSFVNQKVMQESRKPNKGKDALKGNIIEGVMFWRHLWKIEENTVSVPQYTPDPSFMPDPMNPDAKPPMIYTGEQPQTQTKQFWSWEYKAPTSLIWEPTCTTRVQESPYVGEHSKMSLNDLLKWQAEGRITGVEQIKNIIPAGLNGPAREDWEKKRKEALGERNLDFKYADDKEFYVEEWFACITWETGGAAPQPETEMLSTEDAEAQPVPVQPKPSTPKQTNYGEFHFFIVEDQVVVKFEENGLPHKMKPYGSCPFSTKPRSVMGLAACDPIKVISEQANTFAGKQNDLVNKIADPLTFYDDTSGISGRNQFMRTNGLQPVLNVNGIKQMPTDATPVKINQEYINFCIQLCRDITGANDQVAGIEGADTATEYQGLVAAAGTRFAEVADTINEFFIADLAMGCFLFYQQFGVDGQMIVHDTAQTGTSISLTRADLQGDFEFVPTVSQTQTGKEKAKSDDTAFLQMVSTMPPNAMGGQVYNIPKHITEVSLPLRDIKTGPGWFLPAPPPMPMGAPGMPQEAMPQGLQAPLKPQMEPSLAGA